MTEEIDFILESTEESMNGSIAHLEKSFLNIRAGKASPQMLGSVFVDYYGSMTPLSQVSNVNVPALNYKYKFIFVLICNYESIFGHHTRKYISNSHFIN
jgi:hypothetical protein